MWKCQYYQTFPHDIIYKISHPLCNSHSSFPYLIFSWEFFSSLILQTCFVKVVLLQYLLIVNDITRLLFVFLNAPSVESMYFIVECFFTSTSVYRESCLSNTAYVRENFQFFDNYTFLWDVNFDILMRLFDGA